MASITSMSEDVGSRYEPVVADFIKWALKFNPDLRAYFVWYKVHFAKLCREVDQHLYKNVFSNPS
jgi:hypothetical protein